LAAGLDYVRIHSLFYLPNPPALRSSMGEAGWFDFFYLFSVFSFSSVAKKSVRISVTCLGVVLAMA
jgi:hypothetical protein